MAVYAIGDVQGCHFSFLDLLQKIKFKPDRDELIFVGDLVNRGQNSHLFSQWCLANQSNIQTVLGNHDLHLIAIYFDQKKHQKTDTLKKLLNSKQVDHFIEWLIFWEKLCSSCGNCSSLIYISSRSNLNICFSSWLNTSLSCCLLFSKGLQLSLLFCLSINSYLDLCLISNLSLSLLGCFNLNLLGGISGCRLSCLWLNCSLLRWGLLLSNLLSTFWSNSSLDFSSGNLLLLFWGYFSCWNFGLLGISL